MDQAKLKEALVEIINLIGSGDSQRIDGLCKLLNDAFNPVALGEQKHTCHLGCMLGYCAVVQGLKEPSLKQLDKAIDKILEPNEETKTFKECFECYAKPGSPVMCKQCLWVRDNYPPKEPSKQETGEKTLTKQQKSNIAVENFNAGKWRGREDLKQELLEKLPESDAHSLQVWEIKEMLCNP